MQWLDDTLLKKKILTTRKNLRLVSFPQKGSLIGSLISWTKGRQMLAGHHLLPFLSAATAGYHIFWMLSVHSFEMEGGVHLA